MLHVISETRPQMLGILTAAVKIVERVMKAGRLGTRGACCSWVELFQQNRGPQTRKMCHYQISSMELYAKQFLWH
jgi:hypothetical protein